MSKKSIEEHFDDFRKLVAEAYKDGVTMNRMKDWVEQICLAERGIAKKKVSQEEKKDEKNI